MRPEVLQLVLAQRHAAQAVAVPLLRVAAAIAVIAAIAAQYRSSATHPTFDPVNFFSYFTIQSNIITAVVFLTGAWVLLAGKQQEVWLDLARGATVVYMGTTGVIYAVFLHDLTTQNAFNVPWSNRILHQLMPVLVILDWVVVPPQQAISVLQGATWPIFHALWFAGILLRGARVKWYPYPFLNPRLQGGYRIVALYVLGIAVFIGVLCVLVRAIGNLRLLGQ